MTGEIASVDMVKKRTRVLFENDDPLFDNEDELSTKMYINTKLKQDRAFEKLPQYLVEKMEAVAGAKEKKPQLIKSVDQRSSPQIDEEVVSLGDKYTTDIISEDKRGKSLIPTDTNTSLKDLLQSTGDESVASRSLQLSQQRQDALALERPEWHAPWKLMRVMAGHTGWVRSLAMDPENQWFVSGAADRTIKIWDLSSSKLRLTLSGHIMAVRGLVVSPRHPYLFSCSEDKTIKCWDLEKNRVVRDYHGHLSSVYTIDMHPTLDVIATGGRDSSVRIWDIRTRVPIHVLTGHDSSVTNVRCQATRPEVISTSMDGTVRTFDLAAGKTVQVLTHHKKAVRGIAVHELENTFATASSDNIKQWKLPNCVFLQNFEPRHAATVNTMSVNASNVLFSGADDGSMAFFDWKSGHKFQAAETVKMPGSLDSENGIYCSTFDKSGLRLITGEADKSIKIWREDPDATEETHPGIPWVPGIKRDFY